ncbi:MAG: tRNA (adenosine(37)-N6)-threonylcarbamoyltransferase complex ATPase subunit type 1 TsaE [Prevotella sp.]|nr:tRNA (adenosine(37)-N6)-threonylcarbamoyltransferase complex ATPase subunit type 1 TsaE [Prevotella sp.]
MEIKINNIADIRAAARQFVSQMPAGNVFAFYGEMGAGKTTFIKALCQELGVVEEVTSPTFAIVNEYEATATTPPVIYHFDFYRIKKVEEAYDIGFDDYIDSGALCFIEWPEMIEELLPEDATRVDIVVADDGSRTVSF